MSEKMFETKSCFECKTIDKSETMPILYTRNSNFLKPGEMKPPPYSSMSRSTSGSMRSSHSSHHRPTHKPNLAIPNVKNSHNSNDTNTPSTIEDILNEMTVGLPLVSDIAETPRVTIVDSKYTADGKVEPQQRMSPKDASESLKKMLGEPKPLFAEPVHRNLPGSSSLHGMSPDGASNATAAVAAVPMDAKPSGPYNHSLFASYMVKPSVRGSNIIPQPQQPLLQESQQLALSPPTDKNRRSSSTSTNVISSDAANCSSAKADKTSSDMSVDEDSSSSEEGEKDSSTDSSCSDSESNDEKKDNPPAVSPPRPQEEQEEEQQPRWYLKNFLKKSTPDTNNTTRTSQQEESVGMTDPKSSPNFAIQRSEVVELLSEMSDSDSNHSDKQKSQSDSSSSSSSSTSSSEDEDDKKKKACESSCDSDSSYSSRSRTSSKPITDLHKKYSTLAKNEKKDLKKSFEKSAKSVERKPPPVLIKKDDPVEEPAKKKRGRKKGPTSMPKPPPPSKIKSKPLISSDSEDDDEPHKPVKISEKRRGRPPGKKSKVILASSESEEWTDSSRKNRKKDSEKKSSHSLKKTPSWEKNQPQKPVARVSAALRPTRSISSSVDSDSSDVECRPPPMSTTTESPPKLDVEGIKVQDKKKNDTLRKLFITRREEGGAKSGGKSKGGKGGKGGVIIIDNNEAMRNDNERVISPVPVIPPMPKESECPKTSKSSLICRIPLSKLPTKFQYLLKPARSEELRTCADLANTRQEEKKHKHRHHKHHHKSSPSQSVSGTEKSKSTESPANVAPPTQPLLQQPASDSYTKGMVDSGNIWRKPPLSVCAVIPEAKVKPLEHNTMSYLQRPTATSGIMHGPYEESSEDEDGGPPPFLPYSTTTVQIMDPRYKRSLELDQYSPNATKRRKFHNSTTSSTLARYAATRSDGLINDILVDRMHEVPVQPPPRQPSWRMQSMHHQYPPRKGFFSYFVTDLYPENNMHQEVPLKEAQALTKLAEYEPDPITQEMKYLDGILCFVLSGHLMENDGTRERGILKIYNDTIDLIKVIWSKIYNYRADCDHEELDELFEMADNPERDNRLLILWMRCLSFLRLKLFKLLVYQNRQNFKTVQQHFLKNVGSSPISPSPSPASSVESHSSGYCSSSITPSGGVASSGAATGVIGVPIVVHNAMHSEHILYCHLAAAHEMWQRADLLVMRGKHTQFFVEMDRHCGPLTLHSSGHDLTFYARIAISRMRCEFNIKNYLP
ncbi:AF4/FMR2 family member 4-like isoform X5 [Sipha flava]|uniref:AF4/FMR2 family member lilli n=1 Tax=Sipha flava TaxID=143950 RepID=A0A8B8FB02_9HEMI|nr:AF4/FMR2 family member 4-like isoform X5 [Sipha flava]